MAHEKKFQKYQVYFFLYLAVICELLIIIVERDDAEAAWLKEKNELKRTNHAVILELLKNNPVVNAGSNTQLKVGEVRKFIVGIKGLGEADTVTVPPTVTVSHGLNQEILYAVPLPDTLMGQKLYEFEWKAPGAGMYNFSVDAGTNRVATLMDNGLVKVKIGSLEFKKSLVQEVIDSDPQLKGTPIEMFVTRSESLDPAKFDIEVISDFLEQLTLKTSDIVTAQGFRASNDIFIEGTTPEKVTQINPSTGNTVRKADRWAWGGVFNSPGMQTVTLSGRDSRNHPKMSISNVSFKVNVKAPILKNKVSTAYSGEMFEQSVAVGGLENNLSYTWTLTIDGNQVADGAGPTVKYFIPKMDMGKSMVLNASYMNQPYPVMKDSASSPGTSTFSYEVSSPNDHIFGLTASNGVEYPISNVFEFSAVHCGKCTIENREPIKNVSVSVEDANGRDLLDEMQISTENSPDGKPRVTKVRFYLKGKVSKNGTEATVRVKAGSAKQEVRITLIP
jgi:hypothetical protein